MDRLIDSRQGQRESAPRYRMLAQGIFFAAVLGTGVGIGYLVALTQESGSPVAYEGGSLIAVGELESVLYNPDYEVGEEGPTAGLEFENATGQTCRPFTEEGLKGVACRRGGDWSIADLKQVDVPPETRAPSG